MKMWLDCEFNKFGGKLISIAIVDEAGSEFYEVLDWTGERIHPWVAANVLPVLGERPMVDLDTAQLNLAVFLNKYEEVEVRADHPADIQYLMGLLATNEMGDWLEVPPMSMRLLMGLPATKHTSHQPHNALADALALRKADLTRELKAP